MFEVEQKKKRKTHKEISNQSNKIRKKLIKGVKEKAKESHVRMGNCVVGTESDKTSVKS